MENNIIRLMTVIALSIITGVFVAMVIGCGIKDVCVGNILSGFGLIATGSLILHITCTKPKMIMNLFGAVGDAINGIIERNA